MSREELGRVSGFKKTSQSDCRMRLVVCPTTGGSIELSVSPEESIKNLKCTLARRFNVHEEKLSLLYKSRILKQGSLVENQLMDGSKVTLLPNMETGTMNMTPDARVMQALENLSDSQVNDFLTGRSPLLLAMKLGEHMMFVQLQLSAASCNGRRSRPVPSSPSHTHSASGQSFCQKFQEGHMEPPPPTSGSLPHCGSNSASSGAVIDSVCHLGRGVYSGTFSGTLDPSVQDTRGKPKRDITTILQILNDLLVASPQFRQRIRCMPHPTSPVNKDMQQNIGQFNPSKPQEEVNENTELRGKVRRLQMMLEERKQRRQEKRGMRAPYMWQDPHAVPMVQHQGRQRHYRQRQKFEKTPCRDSVAKAENHVGNEATTFAASASNLESESVYV